MRADEATVAATYKDIQQTLGGVPSFVNVFAKAVLPGAWQETKALMFCDNTALPPKMKSLISLAVAAQIPCTYCIWSDTQDARRAGAADEEIREAVAIAALTRHSSTIFNGMQVDFETFKKETGRRRAGRRSREVTRRASRAPRQTHCNRRFIMPIVFGKPANSVAEIVTALKTHGDKVRGVYRSRYLYDRASGNPYGAPSLERPAALERGAGEPRLSVGADLRRRGDLRRLGLPDARRARRHPARPGRA